MPTNISSTSQITTAEALGSVEQLLKKHKGAMISSKDPLVNLQLQHLLQSLYQTQYDSGLLKAPVVIDTSNLSTSDLIALVISEMRKTNHLSATTTIHQIRANQNRVLDNNNKTMQKLMDSDAKLKEASDIKEGLGIFKWVMLAVSVIMVILSAVATVCSFGAAAPAAIAVSVGVLGATVAMTVATSVPIDGENNTAMDLATSKLSSAIASTAKAEMIDKLKDKHKNWDQLSTEEQQDIILEAEQTGLYSTMAIMITLQVIIAVAMMVATFGAAGGASGGMVASTASTTARSAADGALATARAAISANLSGIQTAVKLTQSGLQVVQGASAIGSAGARLKGAELHEDAANDKAVADMHKAVVQMLSRNNKQLAQLIAELYEDIAASQEVCASILKTDHQCKMRMNVLTHGAHV